MELLAQRYCPGSAITTMISYSLRHCSICSLTSWLQPYELHPRPHPKCFSFLYYLILGVSNMASNEIDGNLATCKVVLAGTVAKYLLTEVSIDLAKLPKTPLLVGFLANQDPAARKYAEWTQRTCQEK